MTTDTKKMQDELKDSVHKVWLAGLGAVAMAEEEGSKFLKNLVDKGEAYEARGKERFDEVKGKVTEIPPTSTRNAPSPPSARWATSSTTPSPTPCAGWAYPTAKRSPP